jgi:hypothetical protein
MARLNPIYGLVFPLFITIFAIPLALFATLTTLLAFSVLFFRVIVVYCELALAVIPYYLGQSIAQPLKPASSQVVAIPATPAVARRRKRRSSSVSVLSADAMTPVLGMNESAGATRDFEGVGGWRLGDPEDDISDDQWININSRLSLPADHGRRHKRSLTTGSENVMNTSRSRVRTSQPPSPDEYFPRMALKSAPVLMAGSGSSSSSKGSSVLNMKGR